MWKIRQIKICFSFKLIYKFINTHNAFFRNPHAIQLCCNLILVMLPLFSRCQKNSTVRMCIKLLRRDNCHPPRFSPLRNIVVNDAKEMSWSKRTNNTTIISCTKYKIITSLTDDCLEGLHLGNGFYHLQNEAFITCHGIQ